MDLKKQGCISPLDTKTHGLIKYLLQKKKKTRFKIAFGKENAKVIMSLPNFMAHLVYSIDQANQRKAMLLVLVWLFDFVDHEK